MNTPKPAPSETEPKTAIDESLENRDNQNSQKPNGVIRELHLDTVTKKSAASTDMAKKKRPLLFVILLIVAALGGVGTGFGSYQLYARSGGALQDIEAVPTEGSITAGAVFGSPDTDTFKDSAEGYLESGTPGDEGTHQLLRPGGDMQTVTLTSSVTDLDALVGMQVKVWGETFRSQSSGWLMDVGRVEVLKVKGEKPSEE